MTAVMHAVLYSRPVREWRVPNDCGCRARPAQSHVMARRSRCSAGASRSAALAAAADQSGVRVP
eukprot:2306801-Prymnesium_polylepis.1